MKYALVIAALLALLSVEEVTAIQKHKKCNPAPAEDDGGDSGSDESEDSGSGDSGSQESEDSGSEESESGSGDNEDL